MLKKKIKKKDAGRKKDKRQTAMWGYLPEYLGNVGQNRELGVQRMLCAQSMDA